MLTAFVRQLCFYTPLFDDHTLPLSAAQQRAFPLAVATTRLPYYKYYHTPCPPAAQQRAQ